MKVPNGMVCFLWAAAQAIGQISSVQGPAERVVYDAPSRAIRKLVGTPGSWWLGAPVAADFDWAVISPDGARGIARRGDALLLVSGWPETVVSQPLAAEGSAPEGVAWSPDGRRAWIYSRSANWIEEWTGWPDTPRRSAAIRGDSLAGTLPGGSLLSVTPNATGTVVLVGWSGTGGGLFRWDREAARLDRLLDTPQLGNVVAGEDGFFALDRVLRQIWSLAGPKAEVRESFSLGETDDPVGLIYGSRPEGGGVLFLASGRGQSMSVWDPSRRDFVARIALPVEPSSAERYAEGLYLLRPRAAGEPAWCWAAKPDWTFLFVPAPREESVP